MSGNGDAASTDEDEGKTVGMVARVSRDPSADRRGPRTVRGTGLRSGAPASDAYSNVSRRQLCSSSSD